MTLLGGQGWHFQKSSLDSETLDITSEGLGEMFEGDSADTHTCIKPLLDSRCRVFQNRPPADVHALSVLVHFKPLNLVKVLFTSY